MKVQLIVKAVFFTLLIPGMVTLIVPYFFISSSLIVNLPELSILRILACILGAIGWAILLHCIWGFAFYGKGTLAPINPPQILIVRGLYRYTRNPMYLAVLGVLLAEAVFFQIVSLLVYLTIVSICFHLFVVFYEEPHLRRQFGQQYLEYSGAVPRWGITHRAFNSTGGAAEHL